MVEYHIDCNQYSGVKLSNEEFDKWLFCQNSLGVVDPIYKRFPCQNNNWFTWSNCRLGAGRKLSKLDRFYISPNLELSHVANECWVKVDYSTLLFDHFPIISLLK